MTEYHLLEIGKKDAKWIVVQSKSIGQLRFDIMRAKKGKLALGMKNGFMIYKLVMDKKAKLPYTTFVGAIDNRRGYWRWENTTGFYKLTPGGNLGRRV